MFYKYFNNLLLLTAGTSIHAKNKVTTLNGSSSVTLGSTNKIIVQLVSDSKICGVMGILIPIVVLLIGGILLCTYLGYKKYKGIN